MRPFAELPGTVERLLAGTPGGLPDAALPRGGMQPERVAVVLLDAFGRRFLERHGDHPLLRRIGEEGVVTPVRSQFPATTTSHVTTLHSGLPVGQHGLYEWRVYEPAVGEVIVPLRIDAQFDGTALLPPETLYARLAAGGVDSAVLQPAAFSPSAFDRVAARGARLRPYGGIADGAALLREELARPGRRYAYLYWDGIDVTGHREGPDSAAFARAAVEALDALDGALREPIPDALLLVTADHGQLAVSPERIDDLDVLWPELPEHLAHPPAGSSRDCFLHVRPGRLGTVVEELSRRLGERAEVVTVDALVAAGTFGTVGPRLRARLADVCVLPAPGRQAWLRSAAGPERGFRGHHGGLHPDEAQTWVGALALG